MKVNLTLLTIALFTSQVYANEYAIQLEASKAPELSRYQQLDTLGQLYTTPTGTGYTRARLGPFSNKEDALDALNKVHAAGYQDAFLAKENRDNETQSLSSNPVSSNPEDIYNFDVKTLPVWQKLTTQQRENLVYLDGKLHIKNGDDFTPIENIVK